jgi:hypothetical protein
MAAALVLVTGAGTAAEAQTVTVNRCAAAKMRCVMGYTHICGVAGVEGYLKCHQTATIKGRFVDQTCITRTLDEDVECFLAAERRYWPCLTVGDVYGVHAKIEAFALDAIRDVTPGFPYPISNKCAAGKQKAVADATSAKLECFEETMRREPGDVDPSCLTRPDAFFAYTFDKLESNGGCLTFDDDAALLEKMNAFVADMVVTIDP